MRAIRKYILSLVALLACATMTSAYGQGRVVDARFVPDSVLIGDHFDLIVEVEVEERQPLVLPLVC